MDFRPYLIKKQNKTQVTVLKIPVMPPRILHMPLSP